MWDSVWILAQQAPTATPQGPNFSSTLMFMMVIFGVMWVFLILPNQRRDKQRREMLAKLSKGDHVVTHGGMCGTIVGLTEKNIVLRVSDEPSVKIEFVRGAVSQIVTDEPDEKNKKN